MPLKWKEVRENAGQADGIRGTYRLALCTVRNIPKWPLYLERELIKVCDSKQEGKELAEQMEGVK